MKLKTSSFLAIFSIALLILAIIGVALLYRPLKPAFGPVEGDIVELIEQKEQEANVQDLNSEKQTLPAVNSTDFPLDLPDGTHISIFASDIENARMMAFDSDGVLYLSQTKSNKVVALPDENGDGKADRVVDVLTGVDRPHGLAFVFIESENLAADATKFHIALLPEPAEAPEIEEDIADAEITTMAKEYLYIAETGRVIRLERIGPMEFSAPEVLIDNLPVGGNHFTRSIAISGEKLYVSTGSSCNVCDETEEHRAAVWQYDLDGSNGVLYASGLRNSVGLEFHPRSGKLWGTENSRDLLGDKLPPDEINIIESGKNYGWPYCYGENIHDTNFDKRQYFQNPCTDSKVPQVYLPAHVAPLGFTFYNGPMFKELQDDLLVALHGSWNSSIPVGYKVVRVDLEGDKVIATEDFISGWLSKNGSSYGRPVDVITDRAGSIYISDDKAGVIYRVTAN